jgi:hypothetical protein
MGLTAEWNEDGKGKNEREMNEYHELSKGWSDAFVKASFSLPLPLSLCLCLLFSLLLLLLLLMLLYMGIFFLRLPLFGVSRVVGRSVGG